MVSQLMLLEYEDGSLRVIVHTANLVPSDWENRTQGLWVSPPCPRLSQGAGAGAGESPAGFRASLLRYLRSYKLPCLARFLSAVHKADFSSVSVALLASVPGSHAGEQAER